MNNIKTFHKVILVIIISTMMIGCSLSYKDVPVSDISEAVLEVSNNNFKQGDNKSLKRFYGLNSNDYEEFILYLPSSTMEVNELLIIKVNNENQIDNIEASIEKRIESQNESFRDYAPEQAAIIEENEICTRGKYVFFAISKDAHDMKEAFKISIK